MQRLSEFDIVMPNTVGVFYAGEPVHGLVTLQLKAPLKMRGIYIALHGSSSVRWKNEDNDHDLSASETYFHRTATLYGKTLGNVNGTIDEDEEEANKNYKHPAGRYTYPFRFQLPHRIPTSFEGTLGRIRYYIRATIERNGKFNLEAEKLFTVIGPLNLNRITDVMQPQQLDDQKTNWLAFCGAGPIKLKMLMERKGYVPGQYIPINGEIINESTKLITKYRIELIQKVIYKSDMGHRKSDKDIIDVLEKTEIPSEERVSIKEMFLVPPLPPSRSLGANFIDNKYSIKLIVDIQGKPNYVSAEADILIGTRPLRNVHAIYAATIHSKHNQHNDHEQVTYEVVDETKKTSESFLKPPNVVVGFKKLPDVSSALTGQDGTLHPLPTYVECKRTKINRSADGYVKENVDSSKSWVPKYLFYTWEQPAKETPSALDPVDPLADFQREKTMVLTRASTPALMRMPTGLNLMGGLPEADC